MNKFKVGDRVKRITDDHFGCRVGDVHTVRDYDRLNNLRLEGFPSDVIFMESKFELVKEEQMNKMPELQTGNRVKYRNGTIMVYVKDTGAMHSGDGFMDQESNNLETGKSFYENKNWDIVEVYSGHTGGYFLNLTTLGELIWSESKELSEADILREQMKVLKARLRELGEE